MELDKREFDVLVDAVISYMNEKHKKFNVEQAARNKEYMKAYKEEVLLIDSILDKMCKQAEQYN